MITRQILFDEESRAAILKGVNTLANAVRVTLGVKGRNVIIANQYQAPHITKDGVTVAKSIDLADEIENVGARIIKDVASNTAYIAGDGTTTATVLAQAIITHGFKLVAAGINPMEIKKGIDKAVRAIVANLAKIAIPVENDFDKIQSIATISANNDAELGKLIADTYQKIGKDGIISIEPSQTMETYSEVVGGLQFSKGYVSPYFITNQNKQSVELEDVVIVITDRKISVIQDLINIMNAVKTNNKSLLIIADTVDGSALNGMVVNCMKGNVKCAAVSAPEFGDIKKALLEDIAIVTGAKVISEGKGYKLENADSGMFGHAGRVTITRDSTTIICGGGEPTVVVERAIQIKAQIADSTHDFGTEKLRERLARLLGGVAVLYVGGTSDIEIREKLDRIDDAIRATKAAIEEGIVPGGGTALLRCVKMITKIKPANNEELAGINLIMKCIEAPLTQICTNAGEDGSYIVRQVKDNDKNYGYNAKNGTFGDMVEMGIIDPVKVVRVALENAASASSLLLTSECLIINSHEVK